MLNQNDVAKLLAERVALRERECAVHLTDDGDCDCEFVANRLDEIEAALAGEHGLKATDLTVASSLGVNVALASRDGSWVVATAMGQGREDDSADLVLVPFVEPGGWRFATVAALTPDGAALLSLLSEK